MLATLTVVVAWTIHFHLQQTEVPIRFQRPSKIASRLLIGAVESGAIEADDLKSVLRLYGTEEEITQYKKLISLFDVKPREYHVRFKFSNAVDKIDYQGMVAVRNNVTFTFVDSESNTGVAFRVRMAETGALSVKVRTDILNAAWEKTVSVKSGVQFLVKVPEMTAVNEAAQKTVKSKDPRELPVLAFTVTDQSADEKKKP